jgi:hypothetical protein
MELAIQRVRRIVAGTVLVACAAFAPLAQAQPAEPAKPDTAGKKEPPNQAVLKEAKVRYQRGTELYNDGAYEQALIEFERAYELAPAALILYNIGQVAVLLHDYPKAIRAFEQYLREGAHIPPKRAKQIEEELESLRGRVAYISVKTNVDGAEVVVDDNVVGRAPLKEAIVVNAGRHKVMVRAPGYDPASDTVTLAGTDKGELNLILKEHSEAVPVPSPIPTPGGQEPRLNDPGIGPDKKPEEKTSYVWVGWVTTSLLGAGAVATGIAAIASSRRAEELRETPDVDPSELGSKNDEAKALAIATDVLIGATVVSGAFTIGFAIKEATEDDSDEVVVRATPTGATILGTF